ncbi:hypothetical protein EIL87_24250 [Saccharopolyspora rhizosphaerae]|uniref:Tetracycline repressor TetR C-terminal domain-containing protein n=1 Tax=Saccharopolyspora rhizosphaerae TaxID=2492662 RepID=A0A426JID9_9PSEU|nr:hypothetical protein [Saccharopolyspora rhizosphaerae]RRO12800.1 hypothetical protein EIL87_24250 [Saccharopolyspora rhizosphaerae]
MPFLAATPVSADFGLDDAQRDERMRQLEQYLASLPPDRFPTLLSMVPVLSQGDYRERFEFGIDLLRGLAAQAR